MYDKVWRADVVWEAWREGTAKRGAPGIEGTASEEMVTSGQEEAMSEKLPVARRARRYQCAPVRVVESPKPKGGTRPLGIATGEERVVPTAMKLVLEPLFAADFDDCSSGARPKREAKPAARAMREDLSEHAGGGVESDFKSYCPSIPHGKLRERSTKRSADGSMRKRSKQTLRGGIWEQGAGVPTKMGVPQGSPLAPLYSTIYLNLLDHRWHRRGYPAKRGAPLPRFAEEALLECATRPGGLCGERHPEGSHPQPGHAAGAARNCGL